MAAVTPGEERRETETWGRGRAGGGEGERERESDQILDYHSLLFFLRQ